MYTEAFVAGYYETLNKQAEHEPVINTGSVLSHGPSVNIGGAMAAGRTSSRRGMQALYRSLRNRNIAVGVAAGTSLIGGGAAGYLLAHKKDHK